MFKISQMSPRQSFHLYKHVNQVTSGFLSFKQRMCHCKDFIPDSTFLFVLTVMQCYLTDQERKLVFYKFALNYNIYLFTQCSIFSVLK